jgi:hypothetical protein
MMKVISGLIPPALLLVITVTKTMTCFEANRIERFSRYFLPAALWWKCIFLNPSQLASAEVTSSSISAEKDEIRAVREYLLNCNIVPKSSKAIEIAVDALEKELEMLTDESVDREDILPLKKQQEDQDFITSDYKKSTVIEKETPATLDDEVMHDIKSQDANDKISHDYSSSSNHAEEESNAESISSFSTKTSLTSKPWSFLEELFPTAETNLYKFWEKSPVFLPSGKNHVQHSTSIHQLMHSNSDKDEDRFSHLFKADDSLTVLQNNPHLVHGKDYFILKYLVRDGEEWNGQVPYQQIPSTEVPNLMHKGKFSLVINHLERYCPSLKKMTRSLELETLTHQVSCNMYLTPPNKARAFESHLDWMDVIVLQLEGEKVWSVAEDPMIKLVLPDQKRKPTKADLKATKFRDVLLRQGDALYIPRGYLHNATTPALEHGKYSLHLTFGIEFQYEAIMESLLHHALELFREELEKTQDLAIVFTGASCENGHTLTIVKLLHYAISQLARQTNCGGYGEQGQSNLPENSKERKSRVSDICFMRESIPVHPQFQSLSPSILPNVTDLGYEENLESADGFNDANKNNDYFLDLYSYVEWKYQRILDALIDQVKAVDALNFMNSLVVSSDKAASAERELGLIGFRYIGMEQYEPFRCWFGKDNDNLQNTLSSFTNDFVLFGKRNSTSGEGNRTFDCVWNKMKAWMENERMTRWNHQDEMTGF